MNDSIIILTLISPRGHGDRMIVGFTTTYAISAYHHSRCEFKSHSGEVHSIQHYMIKFVSELRQVGDFLLVVRFPPQRKLVATEILLNLCHNSNNPLILSPISSLPDAITLPVYGKQFPSAFILAGLYPVVCQMGKAEGYLHLQQWLAVLIIDDE